MLRNALLFTIALTLGCTPAPTPAERALAEAEQAEAVGDHKAAIVALKRALDAEPANPASLETALGNVYEQTGDAEKAQAHHEKAIASDPKSHVAWVNLGALQRRQGDYTAAAASYDRAEALAPDYAELHASRGVLLIQTGRPIEAERALRRAIELEPELAVAHANLAVALADQGDHTAAEASLKRAIDKGYASGEIVRARIAP